MSENLKGILAVLCCSTVFVVSDAIVKLVSASLPVSEIIFLRGVMATVLLGLGAKALGYMRPLRLLCEPLMALRVLAAAAASTLVVLSLRDLPLANVNAVLQVTPLAVTAGAALVYGERVGPSRWIAAIAGFIGVLMITKPTSGVFGWSAYTVLVALIFTTTRDLTTRGLPRDIPSMFVGWASAGAIALAGLLIAPLDAAWIMPSPRALWLMLTSAACLFVGNTLLVMSLRTGEIGVVAPFRYAPVPLSLFLGYSWWGDMPDLMAIAGILVVLGAGLSLLYTERVSLWSRSPSRPRSTP
ncbi:MAG: DMT family transporter [Hyphomicrobiaceae bacterium]|nr:DMT family transporter [Hyphomicrobiaceae bacterium]